MNIHTFPVIFFIDILQAVTAANPSTEPNPPFLNVESNEKFLQTNLPQVTEGLSTGSQEAKAADELPSNMPHFGTGNLSK